MLKQCLLGMVPRKRRKAPQDAVGPYIDDIKKWSRASLEENIRVAEDRTAWHKISSTAGAANVRTDDAD